LLDIVDQQKLPFDKYGVKLSRTKLYNIINERIDKYVESAKFSQLECPCKKSLQDCSCRRNIECPCNRQFKTCPCRRSISQSSTESYCSCEDPVKPRPVLFNKKQTERKISKKLKSNL